MKIKINNIAGINKKSTINLNNITLFESNDLVNSSLVMYNLYSYMKYDTVHNLVDYVEYHNKKEKILNKLYNDDYNNNLIKNLSEKGVCYIHIDNFLNFKNKLEKIANRTIRNNNIKVSTISSSDYLPNIINIKYNISINNNNDKDNDKYCVIFNKNKNSDLIRIHVSDYVTYPLNIDINFINRIYMQLLSIFHSDLHHNLYSHYILHKSIFRKVSKTNTKLYKKIINKLNKYVDGKYKHINKKDSNTYHNGINIKNCSDFIRYNNLLYFQIKHVITENSILFLNTPEEYTAEDKIDTLVKIIKYLLIVDKTV